MPEPTTERGVDECVGELLDQAADLTARFLTDRTDLGVSAAFAINRLSREGPVRLTTLAAKEGISQPSMTQLITRLERQDLVTRLPDPDDGRAALVGITRHGKALLDDRRRIRRTRLTELLATLTPEDSDALRLAARVAFPVLTRLLASADSQSTDDAVPPVEASSGDERKVFE